MSSESAASPVRPDRFRIRASWTQGAVGVAAFLILAELIGLVIPQGVLPRMSTVLSQAAKLAVNGQFLADVGYTTETWALGMALTIVIAVPLGLVLGSLPGVRFATRAIVEFLRPIPSVALILLVSLLLGSGRMMSVTLIAYACAWPVLYNTIAGLDDVDPVAKETLRAFGFGRFSIAWRVELPSSAPFIMTSLRIASAIALILDIAVGYLVGGLNGPNIGSFIASAASGAGNTPQILAATFWAGVLGLVFNGLLLWAERRLLPWHRTSP